MNINPISNAYFRNVEMYKKGSANKVSSENITAAEPGYIDKVDFSSKSAVKTDYEDKVMTYKADYNRGVDAARLNELKEQYEGDNCPVSSTDIAHSIINRVIGL